MQHNNVREKWRHRIVLTLVGMAIAFYAVAWTKPMWGFYLYAPQYPYGLVLSVHLDHIGGDVSEIDILNHYVGMSKLGEAAKFERSMAIYGVCGIGLISMLLAFVPGRRYAKYFAMPAMAFPLVFILAMFYWMYRFGHDLKVGAPVKLQPFTPTLFGEGSIGNFKTLGMPGAGFYFILASALWIGIAFWLRRNESSLDESVSNDVQKTFHAGESLRKDPFRLFFPLGALFGAIGIVPWTLPIFGKFGYPIELHRAFMVNGFMLSFVCGFLMTALPRFTSTNFASFGEIATVFGLICTSVVMASCYGYGLGHLIAAFALLSFVVFGARRFNSRKVNPPSSFVFVAVGIFLWLVSNLFLFLHTQNISWATKQAYIWQDVFSNGAIMSLVLGVGGRLIPGILGWQDIVQEQRDRYEGSASFLRSVPFSMWLSVLLYIASCFLVKLEPLWVSPILRTIVIWYFGIRYWNLFRFPLTKNYLTWCVWLSCWCLMLGSLLQLVWQHAYIHVLHVTLIGGFSLLTILVATRVTLAHSSETKVSKSTQTLVVAVSSLLIVAALIRLAAFIWSTQYINILSYAALTWLTGLIIWMWLIVPRMSTGLVARTNNQNKN